MFERVNVRKACGPDRMKAKIVSMCSAQLCHIFTIIMNNSLLSKTIPKIWKCSEIIPVPKKEKIIELNDLRPVALTSVIMKCMEKLILARLRQTFAITQDQLQFAYREGRGVDDAILVFLHNIYKHLDKPKTFCRICFVDFSSAFNTIQPSILVNKLKATGINDYIISWIADFLHNRTQYVKLNNTTLSSCITTNIGAPQGCVLSPILFTFYTNDCQYNNSLVKLIKFADDSSIIGLIQSDNDETAYRTTTSEFAQWCEDHNLLLNIKKTKELIIDFRRNKTPLQPLIINNETVEQVHSYTYLGVTIDDTLDWSIHASLTYKKAQKRMFFLRKLNNFRIDVTLMSLFYLSTIESILTFCITCWGGNVKCQDKLKFDRLIRKAGKIVRTNFPPLDSLYIICCSRKIDQIISDPLHPLAPQIKFSPRSNRPILFHCKTERYRRSFLPSSVKLLKTPRSV